MRLMVGPGPALCLLLLVSGKESRGDMLWRLSYKQTLETSLLSSLEIFLHG